MSTKNINGLTNQIVHGDCIEVMKNLPSESIDLVITDPPYIVNYRSRDGRAFANERNDEWLEPAFTEVYRVLKNDAYCVCFYGWHKVSQFMAAWRKAGFRTLEQLIWVKGYPSSVGAVGRYHEAAYLLGKGNPPKPNTILSSVLEWDYTGNTLHPTQKPVSAIRPLVSAYSAKGDVVLDPFCGSGTTAVAALQLERTYIGIEIAEKYARIAQDRLKRESVNPSNLKFRAELIREEQRLARFHRGYEKD